MASDDVAISSAHPAIPSADRFALTRAGVRRGIVATLPLGIGSLMFGIAFGVLSGGIPVLDRQALGMSVFVYSGAAQMAAVDLITSRSAMVGIWITTLLVSLRYVLLGLTTRRWFNGQPWQVRLGLPFVMSDEVWGMSVREYADAKDTGRRGDLGFFLGSGLTMIGCWSFGTAVGLVVGGRMPDPATFGIDFVATASFVALLAGFATTLPALIPLLVSGCVAVLVERTLPGQWYIPAGALAGLVANGPMSRRGFATGKAVSG